MVLNEEFLRIYEELSDLNESKADKQKLIDFAGEDLANRFLAVKNRMKSPENDLYYWIQNKTPEELAQVVTSIENSKSGSQRKKDIADAGAKLIQETPHWKVYQITTYEASQKYGRDTKWCITGIDGYGDRYWKDYTSKGIIFYFIISKDHYDKRGTDSKFAIAKHPDRIDYEIYNQQDEGVESSEIPHVEELSIPGVDLQHSYFGHYCNHCGIKLYDNLYDDGYELGPDNEYYCDDCFNDVFFVCRGCEEIFNKDEAHEVPYNELYCDQCYSDMFDDDEEPYY